MAVERQQNWQPQQRIDIPHLRALEAGVAGDLDVLVGQMMAGVNPFVVSGFDTVPPVAGVPATSVQINVVSGRICHPLASESGTIFSVPAGRTVETLNISNARVKGSFTASATNYVGLDLLRSADDTTTDLLQILDADTLLEAPKEVPLARTLDYVLVISNQDFATTPNVAPLVKVVTDANNNVVSVEDARNLMFRLGKGGGVTQPLYTYPWAGGRTEVGNNTDFNAGDKVIASFKDWMDAAMTRVWEVGGGEHWYSATSDRNVQLVRNGTTLFTNGDYFEWTGTNLHWRELRFVFPNSTGSFNDVADQLTDSAGLTDLADGQCVYVDIDRTTNRTGGTALVAAKATTLTLGTSAVPGSRYILAWRVGSNIYTRGNSYAVGTTFNPATTTALGMVKLSVTPGAPSAPVVFNPDANGMLTVASTAANANGITSTGNGSGNGVSATGGTSGIGVQGTGGGFPGAGVKGIGGANSAGVVGQGTGTGVGVDATGGATGSAVITHGVANNDSPQVVCKDSAGNVRSLHDHNGYPVGRRSEFRQEWARNDTAYGWFTNPDTSVPGNASYPSVIAQRTGGTTINTFFAMVTQNIVHFGFSAISFVLELDVAYSTLAATNTTLYAGVDPGQGVSASFIGFQRAPGGNWFGTLGVSTFDTGVAPLTTTTPPQRLRVEVHGSASPYGSGANGMARFFINDVPVGTLTAAIPNSSYSIVIGNSVGGTIASVATNTFSGSVYATWNRVLSLPSL